MTLFGHTLDGAQVMGLISLLMMLVLLLSALRGHSAYARWFKQWDGRPRKPAETGSGNAPPPPPVDPASRKGPWG